MILFKQTINRTNLHYTINDKGISIYCLSFTSKITSCSMFISLRLVNKTLDYDL